MLALNLCSPPACFPAARTTGIHHHAQPWLTLIFSVYIFHPWPMWSYSRMLLTMVSLSSVPVSHASLSWPVIHSHHEFFLPPHPVPSVVSLSPLVLPSSSVRMTPSHPGSASSSPMHFPLLLTLSTWVLIIAVRSYRLHCLRLILQ